MVYTPEVAPDITSSLPNTVVQQQSVASTAIDTSGVRYDVGIAGLPFMMNPSPERPYVRQTTPLQKQQFDTSHQAGEQTLGQYWLRSQTSWHRGAGIRFYEPGSEGDQFSDNRFDASVGVDVWTRDEVTLLKKTTSLGASAGDNFVSTCQLADGTNVIFSNESGTIYRTTAAGARTAYTGGVSSTTRVAVAGAFILTGSTTGIDSGTISGSTKAALWTIAAGLKVVPYWLKGRIIATIGPSIYSLTMAGGAIAGGAIIFTHPDTGWTWSEVTDGPLGIYAAGHSGEGGSIYKFTLQDAASGTLPTLGQAYEVATMPSGERITALRSYLGTFLGIGTSRGVRVALLDGNGNVNYGPLIFTTTYSVQALEGHGNYIYAGVANQIAGASGVYRIDLGMPLPNEQLRFAYATDAQTGVGNEVTGVAFFGTTDRVAIAVRQQAVYAQSATDYVDSGYITSGRIRYGTVEKKAFRLLDIRCRITGGSVDVASITEALTEANLITLSSTTTEGAGIGIARSDMYNEYMQFKVTLTSSAAHTVTPTLESFQIKALPAPLKRQRMIQYPLLCLDKETDALGVRFGHRDFSWERIQALETMESERVIVTVQDLTCNEQFEATIEQVEFARVQGRARDGRGNFGGNLRITVKVL